MANRFIESNMWNDSKFADDFTPEDKYFWLMLLTTRYGNLAGCFEFSIKQMAKESGYNVETIEKLIGRFINEYKMIDYDFETKEIIILNWYKYNWTKSPKFEVSLNKFISEIKSKRFREHIISAYKLYCIDTVSIPYRYYTDSISSSISIRDSISISSIKDKDKDKEEDKEKERGKEKESAKSKRFAKPTIEDIENYIIQNNYDTNPNLFANRFYNFYESKGWVIGKASMKNWKATIRTWITKNGIQIKKVVVPETDYVESISDEDVAKTLLDLDNISSIKRH